MSKYKIIIICLFIISVTIISTIKVYGSDFPLLGKVIYIDPGHDCIGNSK